MKIREALVRQVAASLEQVEKKTAPVPAPLSTPDVARSGNVVTASRAARASGGLAAGGFVQHGMAGKADMKTALTEALQNVHDPASKQHAIGLAEAFLGQRGVRTTRTPDGNLRIEPDSKTAYGRFALVAAQETGATTVLDPSGSAVASFNRGSRTIRISCEQLPEGVPADNEMHELIHASVFNKTRAAGKAHPLDGACFNVDDHPILGYEKGFGREEIATHAYQAQVRAGQMLSGMEKSIAVGQVDPEIMAMAVDYLTHEPALAYCRAFTAETNKIALTTQWRAQDQLAGARVNAAADEACTDTISVRIRQENGLSIIVVSDSITNLKIELTDTSLGMFLPGMSPDAQASLIAKTVAKRLEEIKQICVKQLSAVGALESTQKEMVAATGDPQKMSGLIATYREQLTALRNVTLPPNSPLLPPSFHRL